VSSVLQFLTNVFTIPYMALREQSGGAESEKEQGLPSYAPAIAAVAGIVGAISIGWALFGRPESGDLAVR
jgi:hypothetical protein